MNKYDDKYYRKENEPIVFIFDLDHTIIGDISFNGIEWMILKDINNELSKSNMKQINLTNYKNNLRKNLDSTLLRPYFKQFINYIQKYENIEIFIYTASEKDWISILLPELENIIQFKFNRPIFTRDYIKIFKQIKKNSNNNTYEEYFYKKSINHIKPILFDVLKTRYNIQDALDINKIFFVDNTDDILLEKEYLIKCNPYINYQKLNFIQHIPNYYIEKFYYIVEYNVGLKHSNNYELFKTKYINALEKFYKQKDKEYKQFINDNIYNFQNNDLIKNQNLDFNTFYKKIDKFWYNFMLTLHKFLRTNNYNLCLNNLKEIHKYT